MKFVAVVGSAPSSLPDGIGFEKGGEKNQWGVEPHVFLVRKKKNRVERLIQINYLSSHADDISSKKDVQHESEDESSSLSASPLPLPEVGDVVDVQRHEGPWRSMIDPGGLAMVTKVNNDGTVDVRYDHDRRERKRILMHFISQHARQERPANSSDELSAYDSSDSTPRHNRVATDTATNRSSADSRSSDSHSSTSESDSESDWEPDVGDLIFVLKRSWSGMVDEGGHAWVTKTNDDDTVDVRYVIDNRKRKNISLNFITPIDAELSTRSRRRPSRYKSVALPKRRAKQSNTQNNKLSLADQRERQWQEKQKQRERWWERWWQRFPWDKQPMYRVK